MSAASVYQYEDIDYQSAILTTSSISLCFSAVVPITYFIYPTLRYSYSIKLLLYLCICDIITSIGHILPNVTMASCRFQAMLLQYGELSSVLWLCCISYNRYITLKESIVPIKYNTVYHMISWLVPLVFVLINLVDSTYGATDIQCWIPSIYISHRILTFNLPILVILIIFIIYSLRARRLLRTRGKLFGTQFIQQYEYSGRIIIIHASILLLIHVPAILHRTAELNIAVNNNTTSTTVPRSLSLLHAIFSPLQGLVNILLFATSRHVQRSVHLVKSIGGVPLISQLKYIIYGEKQLRGVQLIDNIPYDMDVPIIELPCPSIPSPQPITPTSTLQSHRIFIGTWNVGNHMPPNTLSQWLHTDKQSYDIYIVGVQECAYKVPGTSIVVYSMSPGGGSNCESFWFNLVTTTLGTEYGVIGQQSLWHMRLIILCRTSLIPSVSSVSISSESCGIAHVLGNKGGICITFNINCMSYCIISCHLNAHSGNAERRNSDIIQLLSKYKPHRRDINTYHCIVVCGDLNYRWCGINTEHVMNCIDTNNQLLLSQYDELNCMLQSNSILYGYIDSDVNYWPTYKYINQKSLYKHVQKIDIAQLQHNKDNDTQAIVKPLRSSLYTSKRAPAYTDRILYKVRSGVQIELIESNDIECINTSDHRPIYAVYQIGLDTSIHNQPCSNTTAPVQSYDSLSPYQHHISIDHHIPSTNFLQQCRSMHQINLVLGNIQVYDIFTSSTLPLLEPYLELCIAHSSTNVPYSIPYTSNVALPQYTPTQYKYNAKNTCMHDTDKSATPPQTSPQHQSFLVAEWYDYCVPQLQFTRDTANTIATEWNDPINTDTLLNVLLQSQLIIKLRDRYCTGDNELYGTSYIELSQCNLAGDTIDLYGVFIRDTRYCGYITGTIQLSGSSLHNTDET